MHSSECMHACSLLVGYCECFGVVDAAVLVSFPLRPDATRAVGCELCPVRDSLLQMVTVLLGSLLGAVYVL